MKAMRAWRWGLVLAAWIGGMLPLGGCVKPASPEAEPEQDASAPTTEVTDDPQVAIDTLHPAPDNFAAERIDSEEYPVPPYAKFLAGVKICLDPGHGGDAHKRGFKRGPTGVREAEVNLRVATYLRELLENSGATVLMTRTEDVDSSLEERANLANDWGADLFISCHHNAFSKPETNYTTVWYHGEVDEHPAKLDLARHLCQGLVDELAFPQYTAVPLKSDQLMYPEGFAVLRHARVPAALCESSFFTNPEEEQRLRDPEHNFREAYGMFVGLARYAAGGLPKARLVEPADGVVPTIGGMLRFELDDGLRGRKAWGAERQMILSDTIVVRCDGERLLHAFRNDGYVLEVTLPADLAPGPHTVTVQFENLYKHSVLNPVFEVEAK